MKSALRVTAVAFLLVASHSFADSVFNFKNLNVNFVILPNDGTGDNIGGSIIGAGVNLEVSGGTSYPWFDAEALYAPGSLVGGPVTIYFDFATGTIGRNSYDSLDIQATNLNVGFFNLPTNGKNFTISLPAYFDPFTTQICGDINCNTVNLYGNAGSLTLTFDYDSDIGMYYAVDGSFVSTPVTTPEPATLGMLALGLSLVAARARAARTQLAGRFKQFL